MRLVFVSTFPPRRCGLATFTDNLRRALAEAEPGWDLSVCAIDRDGFSYGPEVSVVVHQHRAEDYRRAARSIALSGADLVVIQHEYGIFGGTDGAYILELADELRLRGVAYAVTLHTILAHPTRGQRATLAALCRGATRVTVFTDDARRLSGATGIADPRRVVVVPHGAPAVLRGGAESGTAVGPALAGALAWAEGARLLTTFGLIGPGKGVEDAITALATIRQCHPEVRYIVAGATHPEVLRRGGERYREALRALVERLGVADHVYLLDAFLTEAELAVLLRRTDIFVTPYRSPDQMCSGALTFALAAGRPVVSTAYRYAVEMLIPHHGNPAGLLVPCRDPAALARALTALLDDAAALAAARAAADAMGTDLVWPRVAGRFAHVFSAAAAPASSVASVPPLCLDHLDRLTDHLGITQFAIGTKPDPGSGYCLDDVARLAIVAVDLRGLLPAADRRPDAWLGMALRFLEAAIGNDGMHNVRRPDGLWRDWPTVGDHVGRAIWALGAAAAVPGLCQPVAQALLRLLLPLLNTVTAPRPLAYAILGLTRGRPGPDELALIADAADRIEHGQHAYPLGSWYEPTLTYDNARLPQAVLAAGAVCHDDDRAKRAAAWLDWYADVVGLRRESTGYLRCVGNHWRPATSLGPSTGEGDEQPIDAGAAVEALVLAWQVTGDDGYAGLARRAFAWFHGGNRAGVPVYDPATGGCRDGLSAIGASENEGAESTLAYHQALLAMIHAGLLPRPQLCSGTIVIAPHGHSAAQIPQPLP